MIKKRLLDEVKESKKYIFANVFFQWLSLGANAIMMFNIAVFCEKVYYRICSYDDLFRLCLELVFLIIVRSFCMIQATKMSCLSYKSVKKTLREKIYTKLLRLGMAYNETIKTSEIIQIAVEGVDQLETYFGSYLPQLFYSVLAPLTLFGMVAFINLPSAIVLLVCVPMIPFAIVVVQKWAKKLLSKYWGQYTALGDTFLENLQGLTTLKIYQTDEMKHQLMNEESEKFRKITMKVLTMQLNSITIMDLVAYGGAAAGMIVALCQFEGGNIDLKDCLLIILLSADFFIPMRQLGSFFHIAMNGMAASDKIFRLLDAEEPPVKSCEIKEEKCIEGNNLSFSYQKDREILHQLNFTVPQGGFVGIVGESGCGKSTLASILMGRNKNYTGSITIGNESLNEIKEESLMENITYISHKSTLFKGTVRENLLMGKKNATDDELWEVLKEVNLAEFIKGEHGLETKLDSQGMNFSGGQRQRLALARAILHDSPIYIFDEATSNIDVESENQIMKQIVKLSENKTVILISHRLMNVVSADLILVMKNGEIVGRGQHDELYQKNLVYKELWEAQQKLEKYTGQGGTL